MRECVRICMEISIELVVVIIFKVIEYEMILF